MEGDGSIDRLNPETRCKNCGKRGRFWGKCEYCGEQVTSNFWQLMLVVVVVLVVLLSIAIEHLS
jgi:hypothetical protein